MALATLSIDLVAKLAALEQDLGQAVRLNEKAAARIEGQWNQINGTLKTVGATVAAVFAGASFDAFYQSTVGVLDSLNDLSDATGSTIENISAVKDVADRTGTSMETWQSSIIRLNAVLLKGGDENKGVGAVLKAIGLSAEELRQIDPAEALLKVSQGLAQVSDDGERARGVYTLFGKSVAEVGPLLKDLAEAGQLNATVTADQAKAAEAFRNQIRSFETDISNAARSIVGDLLPAINELLKRGKAANEAFGTGFFTLGDRQRAMLKGGTDDAAGLTKALQDLAAVQGKLAGLDASSDPRGARRKAWDEEAEALRKVIAYYRSLGVELTKGVPAVREAGIAAANGARPSLDIPDPGGNTATKVDAVQRYIDSLKDATFSTLDLTRLEKVRLDFLSPALANATAKQRQLAEEYAATIDRLNRAKDKSLMGPVMPADIEALRALKPTVEILPNVLSDLERLNQLLAGTDVARRQQLQVDIELLTAALERSADPTGKVAEALRKAQDEYDAIGRKVEETGDKVSVFADEMARNIQDQLGSSLFDIAKGNFDNILDAWGDMLLRMATQAAAAQIGEALFGTKGQGGLLSTFLAFAGGGSSSTTGVAAGSGTETGWLGGTAGPAAASGGALSAGRSITIINNVQSGVSRNEMLTALQLTNQQQAAATQKQLKAAGVA